MGVGAGMFDGLATMFLWAMLGLFGLGIATALFCVYTIPWLWHLLKPLLHTWTG